MPREKHFNKRTADSKPDIPRDEYPLSYDFYTKQCYVRMRLEWPEGRHPMHGHLAWNVGVDRIGDRALIIFDGEREVSNIHPNMLVVVE